MVTLHDEFMVCTHYLSAMVNGDYSGLEPGEDVLVNSWLDDHCPPNSWLDVSQDEPEFARDAVSGLMADCLLVQIYTTNEREGANQ
jgi:hypothetical protein